MPRAEIRRDSLGGKITGPSRPGMDVITVSVSYPQGIQLAEFEQIIWETATGHKDLHQTAKAKGNTMGGKGYIHPGGSKKLLLVSRLDTKKRTIEILREGHVNGKMHMF